MNADIFWAGLAHVTFGLVTALVMITLVAQLLGRLVGWGDIRQQVTAGNAAAGILYGGALLALGILVQRAVSATFTAMDLLYRGATVHLGIFVDFLRYALGHVGISMLIGAIVLAVGARGFDRLTVGIDEFAEVKNGNVAAAIVLACVLIVVALLVSPGLSTMLDGLLPFPDLARDVIIPPSAR